MAEAANGDAGSTHRKRGVHQWVLRGSRAAEGLLLRAVQSSSQCKTLPTITSSSSLDGGLVSTTACPCAMGMCPCGRKRSLSTEAAVNCRCSAKPSGLCRSSLVLASQWSLSLRRLSMSDTLRTTSGSLSGASAAHCLSRAVRSTAGKAPGGRFSHRTACLCMTATLATILKLSAPACPCSPATVCSCSSRGLLLLRWTAASSRSSVMAGLPCGAGSGLSRRARVAASRTSPMMLVRASCRTEDRTTLELRHGHPEGFLPGQGMRRQPRVLQQQHAATVHDS